MSGEDDLKIRMGKLRSMRLDAYTNQLSGNYNSPADLIWKEMGHIRRIRDLNLEDG